MFNARNELDQSRFSDDLGESIAEMDEMESIRAHNIVDSIHSKYQERLKRHNLMHNDPKDGSAATLVVPHGGSVASSSSSTTSSISTRNKNSFDCYITVA